MGHNFRKLTTNIIEKAKDELGYGMKKKWEMTAMPWLI